ncbi:MAG TPA: FAD-dependent monooxygenase [Chthoniobacterales bacterium]|nr:FAD-dependent monooxygenase [Chthoniobacterales bacterium]
MIQRTEDMKREVTVKKSFLGRRAVVVGAGLGGLSAARVLADYFDEVIILDRDDLPDEANPRPGVPQGKHPHGLLGAGLKVLENLFPGFGNELMLAGAEPMEPGFDMLYEIPGQDVWPRIKLGWPTYAMSRPLIERTLRQQVERIANLKVRRGCRVLSIVSEPHALAARGVRYEGPDGNRKTLESDVVVDGSGNGSLTVEFLKTTDRRPPAETRIGVNTRYASAFFERVDIGNDYKGVFTFPDAPEHSRGGLILPAENHRYQVVLIGRGNDIPPVNGDEFMSYARTLPTPSVYNAIKNAKRLTGISPFAFAESRWRHFARVPDFPNGLIPIGDAICRLNPVYGQGMTVALQEASLLFDLLRAGSELATLAPTFLAKAETLIADPWSMSAIPDFIYPETTGERPGDLEERLNFQRALGRLAVRDAEVYELLTEIRHVLRPLSLLDDPSIVRRVKEEIAKDSQGNQSLAIAGT